MSKIELPHEWKKRRWTLREYVICILFMLMVLIGFCLLEGSARADKPGYNKRDRLMERVVKAEEDQARSLKKIASILERMQRK